MTICLVPLSVKGLVRVLRVCTPSDLSHHTFLSTSWISARARRSQKSLSQSLLLRLSPAPRGEMPCLRKRKKKTKKTKTNNLTSTFFGYTIFLPRKIRAKPWFISGHWEYFTRVRRIIYIIVILFVMTQATRACIQKR